MWLNYLTLLKEIHFVDLLDIAFSSCIVWLGFAAIQTRRTWKIGAGLFFYGLIMLIANQLELALTLRILQGLSAVLVLVVVVSFQAEIRRLLEELWVFFLRPSAIPGGARKSVPEQLVRLVYELSELRWGALVILPGKMSLEGLITSGVKLDGIISRPLLLSLFDPDSPGHDGGMVVQGERIELFGSRLPLTEKDEQLQEKGTRHAAAIGLTEKCDAMVLVVSEESGTISLARDGLLQKVNDSETLREEIEAFFTAPDDSANLHKHSVFYLRMALRMVCSVLITAVVWLVLVPGSAVVTAVYQVPIEVQNIPEGFVFESVSPATAEVSLTGERRDLFKLKGGDLLITLDGTLTGLGRQTYRLNNTQMTVPANIDISNISPASVKVLVLPAGQRE